MPYCPHCGALVAEEAIACRNCGASLQMPQTSPSQSPQSVQTAPIPSTPQYPPERRNTRNFATLGVVSAILSLFVAPEVFGSAAIILGAYVWRKEQGNRGIGIVVFGIISLLVGLIFTSFFALIDLIPS